MEQETAAAGASAFAQALGLVCDGGAVSGAKPSRTTETAACSFAEAAAISIE